ncbi:hypothetical protein GIB67_034034 [Kingdonia uniflora]|uniref:Aldehyde dehydrogenase domain-containing protein n=1 Tax=Kingdonia uniflora TaxID=39325 RepID=A0A7J7M635_9MAGN|nr:hypothetical protein GIB67_034034 [Kingdonia uniflora]
MIDYAAEVANRIREFKRATIKYLPRGENRSFSYNLAGWDFSKIIELNFEQFGSMDGNNKATGEVLPEPFGVVLILSPWNYPILLALDPLIGAIATVIILAPLANTIPSYIDDKAVMVAEGGASIGKQLFDQKWDKILNTLINWHIFILLYFLFDY